MRCNTPVSGKVTLDGTPLADAQVQFKTANQATFTGATDSTGTYKLWSATGGEQLLLPRYWDPARAVLNATVPTGGGTFDFPLESK